MTGSTLEQRLAGIVGIPVVPFGEAGDIDHELMVSLLRRTTERDVDVLTVNGNTGEFYTLSPQERRDVVRSAAEALQGRATMIVGVGLDLTTAKEEAQCARELGAQGIMIHQPVNPYLSPAGWVEYNAQISAVVPELGVVPYLTSPLISAYDIDHLMERAPNVVGIKCSLPDPAQFGSLRAGCSSDIVWIAGLAESYAPAYWQFGARGFTSGLINVAPEISVEMLSALRAGDAGRTERIWRQVRRFEELRARDRSAANVSVVKEAMAQRGLCSRQVRPPSAVLGAAARDEVREAISGWDLLEAAA